MRVATGNLKQCKDNMSCGKTQQLHSKLPLDLFCSQHSLVVLEVLKISIIINIIDVVINSVENKQKYINHRYHESQLKVKSKDMDNFST